MSGVPYTCSMTSGVRISSGGPKQGGARPRQRTRVAYRPTSDIWVPLSPTGERPPARYAHTAVWDSDRARMLVGGGCCGDSDYLSDLWAYETAYDTWVPLNP